MATISSTSSSVSSIEIPWSSNTARSPSGIRKHGVTSIGDFDSGSGDDASGYYEVREFQEGEVEFYKVYRRDGSDGKQMSWLRSLLRRNWSSIEEGGVVLTSANNWEEIWRYETYGDVEPSGNEGATRETTYNTCFLVVYSKDERG